MITMHPRSSTRAVALAAAYLIAVQTSLAAFALVASAGTGVICVSAAHAPGADGRTAPPVGHGDGVLCVLSCGALPPPERTGGSWNAAG